MSGNLEIGNGYGVPGGCAFYGGSKPGIVTHGKMLFLLLDFNVNLQIGFIWFLSIVMISGNNAIGQNIQGQVRETEQNSAAKELPEYLKQKLRARGILKDNTQHSNSVRTDTPNFAKQAGYAPLSIFYRVLVIIENDKPWQLHVSFII